MFWETKKCSYLTYNCLINFSFLFSPNPFVFFELLDTSRGGTTFSFKTVMNRLFVQINYKQKIMGPEPSSATNKFHSV